MTRSCQREGSPEKPGPGDNARLAGMTWAHMVNDGATNYLPGVLPAVLIDVHEPLSLAGALVAALAVGQGFQPLVGLLSDRVGGRSVLITGFAMTSLGGALLGDTHSFGVLVLLLLMIGLGTSMFHPQALASIRSITRGRRGLRTSIFLVGGEAGRGLWPTLASLIVVHFGVGYLWIIGIPGVATIWVLFHFAPSLAPKPRSPRGQQSPPIKAKALLPVVVLVVYAALRAFAVFGLVTFIPILWHERGDSLVSGASVISVVIVVGIVGNLSGGHLTDLVGRRLVLIGSAATVAALLVPMGYVQGLWLWILAGVLGCSLFMTLSTTIMIGQDIFPANPSLGSGVALGLSNAIGAVMVLLASLFIDPSHIYVGFVVMAAGSALSIGVAFAFPRGLMTSHF